MWCGHGTCASQLSSHRNSSSQASSRSLCLPTWSANHLGIKLGKPQAGAGFARSYSQSQAASEHFQTPQLVGHPRPFLMGHLCGLICYLIRRSLPWWCQGRDPHPDGVPIVQSMASSHVSGPQHSKQFVKYLGAICPTLPVPRAFMPTTQLQTLTSPDVQFNQLSAPDRGRAESSGVPGFKHSS